MRFMFLISGEPPPEDEMTLEAHAALVAAWYAYTDELRTAGNSLHSDALHPAATATTLTIDHGPGQIVTTDGPYAETKEHLGGYSMIEADDQDDALTWAPKMPLVTGGVVEVRPALVFDSR